jgi:hypothetical protein
MEKLDHELESHVLGSTGIGAGERGGGSWPEPSAVRTTGISAGAGGGRG